MRVTTVPFSLLAWRQRMRYTQVRAAAALGYSVNGYCAAEYRNTDTLGHPCDKTVALLAEMLEEKALDAFFAQKDAQGRAIRDQRS